jgi:hypothetical protein
MKRFVQRALFALLTAAGRRGRQLRDERGRILLTLAALILAQAVHQPAF